MKKRCGTWAATPLAVGVALALGAAATQAVQTSVGGADVGTLIGADAFYDVGFTGQGTIAANVEAGHIWNGHETLTQVTGFVNGATTYHTPGAATEFDRHATWVGMLIGGRSGAAQGTGIAPGTELLSGAIATSWSPSAYSTTFGVENASIQAAYGSLFGTVDVINSSWGYTDADGNSPRAIAMDAFADQNPRTTFVVDAGNSGSAGNSVLAPGSGYNAITVGALANGGNNGYAEVSSGSSRGPQDFWDPVNRVTISEVRAAVDIVAPGTELVSAYYGGQTGGNSTSLTGSPAGPAGSASSYTLGLGGTSFAAPIVAGAAALINSASYNTPELYGNSASRDSRVVKAVLLNSAHKILGWDNGQTVNPNGQGGVFTSQSLDWTSGAGALDLAQAFDQYIGAGTRDLTGLAGGSVAAVGWDLGQVALGGTSVYLIDAMLLGGSTMTLTLDWMRARTANPTGSLNQVDVGQANLDLIVRDSLSGLVISESRSLYNVVEHLAFALPRTSAYQIEVVYTGETFGTQGLEQFGLAWNTTVPEPATWALLLAGTLALPRVRRSPRAGRV